jgi:hypothetical protein
MSGYWRCLLGGAGCGRPAEPQEFTKPLPKNRFPQKK